jgi:hypothetical protein
MKELEQKIFELTPEDVELRGLPEGFTGSIGMLLSTRILVKGNKASLENVTMEQLAPYIDLSDIIAPGSYRLNVCFDNPGNLIMDAIVSAMVDVEYRPQAENPDVPQNGAEGQEDVTGDNTVSGGTE